MTFSGFLVSFKYQLFLTNFYYVPSAVFDYVTHQMNGYLSSGFSLSVLTC